MSLVSINLRPARKDLRDFGEAALAMMTGLGLALWAMGRVTPVTAMWFAAAGLATYVLSRAWAPLVKPVYLVLVIASWPIGWVVSHAVLAVTYYLVITPIGVVMRLLGKDPMQRGFDSTRASYWQAHRAPQSMRRYFDPF